MSVTKCLNKAGKSIDKKDGDAILQKYEELLAKGMDEREAGFAAVREIQQAVDSELDDIASQVEKAGGKVERDAPGQPVPMAKKTEDGVQIVDARAEIAGADDVIKGIDDVIACVVNL